MRLGKEDGESSVLVMRAPRGEPECGRTLYGQGISGFPLERRGGVEDVEDTGDCSIGDNDPAFWFEPLSRDGNVSY